MEKCVLCNREFKSVRGLIAHVKSHNEVTVEGYWELVLPPKLCECGCGGHTPVYRGKRNKFIAGHNFKGSSNPNIGKKYSKERKDKIRKSNLGLKRSEETKKKISAVQKELWTKDRRKAWGESQKGEKSPNWKDGRTKVLKSKEYNAPLSVIKKVRERDNNTCQMCGITKEDNGRNLDVHHIVPYLDSQDNSLENLISLCRKCHGKADRLNLTREEILTYNK